MLLLTNMLLLGVAFMFGVARRPWWQIGLLAIVACAPLQFAQFWVGDWRYGVGLSYHEQTLESQIVWIVGYLLCFTYVGYALGVLYSRWRRI